MQPIPARMQPPSPVQPCRKRRCQRTVQNRCMQQGLAIERRVAGRGRRGMRIVASAGKSWRKNARIATKREQSSPVSLPPGVLARYLYPPIISCPIIPSSPPHPPQSKIPITAPFPPIENRKSPIENPQSLSLPPIENRKSPIENPPHPHFTIFISAGLTRSGWWGMTRTAMPACPGDASRTVPL